MLMCMKLLNTKEVFERINDGAGKHIALYCMCIGVSVSLVSVSHTRFFSFLIEYIQLDDVNRGRCACCHSLCRWNHFLLVSSQMVQSRTRCVEGSGPIQSESRLIAKDLWLSFQTIFSTF